MKLNRGALVLEALDGPEDPDGELPGTATGVARHFMAQALGGDPMAPAAFIGMLAKKHS